MNDAASIDNARSAAAPAGSTPMMAQYFEIRAVNPGCLLFYRMGDFYELFFEDAEVASRALGIALTRRGKHLGEDIPMCGVPVHAAHDYLKKLISLGHRVAVCEQVEDPAEAKKRGAKSVVRRDVVRLVTAGTLTEDDLLSADSSNYLMAIAMIRHGDADFAAAWADISTGEVHCADFASAELADEIARVAPAEIILAEATREVLVEHKLLPDTLAAQVIAQPPELFSTEAAPRRLAETWSPDRLDPTTFSRVGRAALAALAGYIADTQKGAAVPLRVPRPDTLAGMVIDAATRNSLELVRTQRGDKKGALLDCVDACVTPAGSRLLAARLSAPSRVAATVNARLDMVAALADDTGLIERLRGRLRAVPDIARALTRLAVGRGGPRDLRAIADAIAGAGHLAAELAAVNAPPPGLEALASTLAGAPEDLALGVDAALADDLPLFARDGGLVRAGYDPALDTERRLASESRAVIASLQARYAELAAVKALKVRHNNVLGYFVEVPAAHGDKLLSAPLAETFIHRQTMANAKRFATTELGELESRIARAAAAALDLELAIFDRLRAETLAQTVALQTLADALAETDLVAALALVARERDWCRPVVDDGLDFRIVAGRHPVVERTLKLEGRRFVCNDCDLGPPPGNETAGALWLLTGPNMGGKSTFLRQNALIAILAQAGAFVPADSAQLGIVDRVFSRVGASDDIAHGRSTFMVEMVETAAILGRATARSLVVLDEIGRGTATFDGLSIAWACVEALHDGARCRALFATHFHELTALAGRLARVSNHTMKVREYDGDVIFLHEVAPGSADRSYGIQVARLAGLPDAVVERAREVLMHLESRSDSSAIGGDLPLFSSRPGRAERPAGPDPVQQLIEATQPDELTPRQAIDVLYELKNLRNARRDR